MGPDQLDELLASIRSEEGPAELDELLETIRSEGKKERGGALALYQGTRGTDLVDEYIDERVVRILGLGQVFDIDYATYLTLLKEKLVQVSMGGGSLAREEQMLLQDEFKRVKGKVGRFKLKAKRAQISRGLGTTPLRVSKEKFYLTSNAIIPKNPSIEKVSEDLQGVQEALDKLLAEIRADNKEEKRQAEIERRNKIRNRRIAREKLLETSQKKVSSVVTKLVSPLRGILDKIFRFLFFGFLSGAVPKLIEWLANPANKEKVDSMFRFLKDFWPAIAGGLLLFFTPFGGFVRGIVGILGKFVPALARLVVKNPKVAGAALAAGLLLKTATSQSPDPERAAQGKTELDDTQDFGGMTGAPISGDMLGFNQGGLVPTNNKLYNILNYFSRPIERETGKITSATGTKIKGAGPDTQLIAAQPGEFVMTKKAVDTYGPRFFMNINDSVGATNIPTFSKGIQFAQSGGMVGGLQGLMTSVGGVGGLTGSSTMMSNPGGLTGSSSTFSNPGGLTGSSTSKSSPGGLTDSSTSKSSPGGLTGSSTSKSSPGGLTGSSAMMSNPGGLTGSSAMMSNPGGLSGSRTSSNYIKPSTNFGPSLMKAVTPAASSKTQARTSEPRVTYKNPKIAPQQMKAPPGPPERSMRPNVTMLPEIVRGAEGQMVEPASNMSIPSFSASQSNSSRDLNFAVYGIEGMN